MENDRWKMSEDYRTLLAEERARAEHAHIAKILARKNIRDPTLAAPEPAEPAPLPAYRAS